LGDRTVFTVAASGVSDAAEDCSTASAARSASSVLLRRGALDVDRPWTLRALGHVELDSITLAQIGDALAIDSALVKEIVLARLTFDEPKTLVYSQRPNYSQHLCFSDFWCLTIAVDFNSTDAITYLLI